MEQPEQIMCIIGDSGLIKIVAVWGSLGKVGDLEELEIRTGLSKSFIDKAVEKLKLNGVIYDDGKVNEYAIQYVRSRIAKAIKGVKR